MFKQTVRGKTIKFLLGGILVAFLNIILMIVLISRLGWDTPILRNVANIVAIEISLIAGFFIYRLLVWTGGSWHPRDILMY